MFVWKLYPEPARIETLYELVLGDSTQIPSLELVHSLLLHSSLEQHNHNNSMQLTGPPPSPGALQTSPCPYYDEFRVPLNTSNIFYDDTYHPLRRRRQTTTFPAARARELAQDRDEVPERLPAPVHGDDGFRDRQKMRRVLCVQVVEESVMCQELCRVLCRVLGEGVGGGGSRRKNRGSAFGGLGGNGGVVAPVCTFGGLGGNGGVVAPVCTFGGLGGNGGVGGAGGNGGVLWAKGAALATALATRTIGTAETFGGTIGTNVARKVSSSRYGRTADGRTIRGGRTADGKTIRGHETTEDLLSCYVWFRL